MYVDFKVTHWERVEIPDDFQKEAENIVKNNSPAIANHIMTCDKEWNWKVLPDTEEFLSPKDNLGEQTIEIIINEEIGSIWNNSLKHPVSGLTPDQMMDDNEFKHFQD